ncbi:DnaJ domain-containing protein [Patescibacteria group bacterium]
MVNEFRDYYAILGVDRNATESEIKKAFRKRARETHPDVNPGDPEKEEEFKLVNEANQVLSDSGARVGYDRLYDSWKSGEGMPFDPWQMQQQQARREGSGAMWGNIDEIFRTMGLRDWGEMFNLDLGFSGFDFSGVFSSIASSQANRKAVRQSIHELLIPESFTCLLRAIYRVQRDGGRLVVNASRTSGVLSEPGYPLWRVTKEDNQIVIEFSPALLEGRRPETREFSKDFKWVRYNSDEARNLLGEEGQKLVSMLFDLAIDHETVIRQEQRLRDINRLSEVVKGKLNISIDRYKIRNIGNNFFDEHCARDVYLYSESERLVVHEKDLALLSFLTMGISKRLPDEEILVLYERRPVWSEGHQYVVSYKKIPYLVADTRQGKPKVKTTKTNPDLHRDREAYKEYSQRMIQIAKHIRDRRQVNEGIRSFLLGMAIQHGSEEVEGKVVELRLSEKRTFLFHLEGVFRGLAMEREGYSVDSVEARGIFGSLQGHEGVFRMAVEGDMKKLKSTGIVPCLKEKEEKRGGGPEGIY